MILSVSMEEGDVVSVFSPPPPSVLSQVLSSFIDICEWRKDGVASVLAVGSSAAAGGRQGSEQGTLGGGLGKAQPVPQGGTVLAAGSRRRRAFFPL